MFAKNRIQESMGVNINDDLFRGITYSELVDTVISNYGENATASDVIKTYNEIKRMNERDASSELKDNMKDILLWVSRGY